MSIAEWAAVGAMALTAIAALSGLVKVLLDRRPTATTAAATAESLNVQSSETAVKTVSDVLAIVKQARAEENLEHAKERAADKARYIALEARVLALEGEKATLSQEKAELNEKFREVTNERDELRGKLETVTTELTAVRCELTAVRAELTALQQAGNSPPVV